MLGLRHFLLVWEHLDQHDLLLLCTIKTCNNQYILPDPTTLGQGQTKTLNKKQINNQCKISQSVKINFRATKIQIFFSDQKKNKIKIKIMQLIIAKSCKIKSTQTKRKIQDIEQGLARSKNSF